jgi:hypothetical protein
VRQRDPLDARRLVHRFRLMNDAVSKRLQTWEGFPHRNAHPHDCRGPCPRCESESIAERVAIQTEGKPVSAFERAIELLKERRRPGQRALAV